MSNPLEELDKTLGIVSDVEILQKEPWNYEHKVVSVDKEKDIESDYEYQRQNFYNLVEKGTAAIDGILLLAKESEHPRTYEVAGNLIKQVSEVPNTAPKNVTNALFVGSTAELQKMIKGS